MIVVHTSENNNTNQVPYYYVVDGVNTTGFLQTTTIQTGVTDGNGERPEDTPGYPEHPEFVSDQVIIDLPEI